MKNILSKLSKKTAMLLALLLLFSSVLIPPVDVLAIDEEEITVPEEPYDSGSSIVQVIFYFQDDDGNNHILQTGSGILVAETTVITSHFTTTLGSKYKNDASAYYTEKFGEQIRFDEPPEEEKDDWKVYTPKLAVVDEGTVFVDAKAEFDDTSFDIAILTLDKPLTSQLEYAVLGDSNLVAEGDTVKTQGFYNLTENDQKSFSRDSLMEYDGVCVESTEDNLKYYGYYHWGFVGGPVVDEYGRVVAVIVYKEGEKEAFSSFPINKIKPYIGSNVREDTNDYKEIIENHIVNPQDDEEKQVNRELLNEAISYATYIYEQNNEDEIYTEESFAAFKEAYNAAVSISEMVDTSEISQGDVDTATKNLTDAQNALEKVKKKNKTLFIVIIVASVLLAILLILLIVFLVIRGRRKKLEKEEAMRIKTIDGATHGNSGILNSESANMRNVGLPSAQLYAQFDAKARENRSGQAPAPASGAVYMEPSTTILQDEDSTTVLNSFVQAPINAYLYRSRTGESVAITSDKFRVGKNTEGIEYRVDGNTNISRFHAVITRSNESYFIEDLGSTNYTFVNSVRIMPNRKQQLQSNDVIYLADEEFIFMMNS